MPSLPEPFRVAIIGGGIGGLFTALCINHQATGRRIEIDVYEQASEFKEIGAGVGLAYNAAKLVHFVGLGEGLNKIAGFRSGIWITFRRYDNGGEILTTPVDDTKIVRQAPVARSELLDLYRHGIIDRKAATLHTNKQCRKVEDEGETVTIHFTDSTTASAHLVIACDGIHSSVRNQFVDDQPIYSGQIAYRAVIPVSEIEKDWPLATYSGMWCAKHKHFLTFPISSNRSLNIVAFANAKAKDAEKTAESWTSVCDRKEVEEDYAAFEPTVQRLISLMPEKPSKWRINDREPLDRWHYFGGKVMLLGDAAHAMLPHLGAGAGQAMEDAWILGRCLKEYVDGTEPKLTTLQGCASFYQDIRKPRAQKVQRTSRVAGATYDMQSEDMLDKDYDTCAQLLAERTKDRMKFVWEEDLDAAYEKAKLGPSD